MNNIAISFVANGNKTWFFNEIAKVLAKLGFKIYWFVFNKYQYKLLSEEWGKDNVLHLPRTISSTDFNFTKLNTKINDLLYSDRMWSKSPSKGKKYLLSISPLCEDFISKNAIKYCFGELTWAHEILIYRICREMYKQTGVQYLNPHLIRSPAGYFAFFNNESQSSFKTLTNCDKDIIKEKAKNLKAKIIAFGSSKPEYFSRNEKKLKGRFSFFYLFSAVYRFLFHNKLDYSDPTLPFSRRQHLWMASMFYIKSLSLNFFKFKDVQDIQGNFVTYFLHKQPEASIDVIGKWYSDQQANILNIWRSLPLGWSIVVKDHSNAIGDRGLCFFRALNRFPGIYIINPYEDSSLILGKTKAVFTVSGTVAHEAALQGVASYTFAPCYFNVLHHCQQLKLNDFDNVVYSNEKGSTFELGDLTELLATATFKGVVGDPVTNPQSIDKNNINDVVNGFVSIMSDGK